MALATWSHGRCCASAEEEEEEEEEEDGRFVLKENFAVMQRWEMPESCGLTRRHLCFACQLCAACESYL